MDFQYLVPKSALKLNDRCELIALMCFIVMGISIMKGSQQNFLKKGNMLRCLISLAINVEKSAFQEKVACEFTIDIVAEYHKVMLLSIGIIIFL